MRRYAKPAAALLLIVLWLLQPASAVFAQQVAAIDIGHTPENPGALSARNRPEYAFNWKMAHLVARLLRTGSAVSPGIVNEEGEDISLDDRARHIEALKPCLLISIHHDSVQPCLLSPGAFRGEPAWHCDKYRGYSLFISRKNFRYARSLSLAAAIGNSLRAAGFFPSGHHAARIPGENRKLIDPARGIYLRDNLTVLRGAPYPAVLIECGVIKNKSEEMLFRNPAIRMRFARAVARGVLMFCRK